MFDVTSIDLTKPHTVVIVKSRCRLPFTRGILGPGIYHFPNDYRTTVGIRNQRLHSKTCELYFLAGDTPEVLAQIACIKEGRDPSEALFDALAELDESADESANDERTNGGVGEIGDEVPSLEEAFGVSGAIEGIRITRMLDRLNKGPDAYEEPGGLMAINPDNYKRIER